MKHIGTKQIETEHLILRRFTMDDAEAMYKNWASNDEVTKYLTWPSHTDVEVSKLVLKSWLEDYGREDCYNWAIVYKENGTEPIGSISVVSSDDKVMKAHIGYCIGKRWWHKGIMSEALKSIIDFLFDEVGMQRIDARHDTRNPHSGDVMKKCGMKYEGTHRQSDWNNQGINDSCWYAILATERIEG